MVSLQAMQPRSLHTTSTLCFVYCSRETTFLPRSQCCWRNTQASLCLLAQDSRHDVLFFTQLLRIGVCSLGLGHQITTPLASKACAAKWLSTKITRVELGSQDS